jgi:hypothetical protein
MDNITVNFAASKEFAVTERWKFQLRGEAFNLANRPIYRPAPFVIVDINFGKLSIEQQNFPTGYSGVGEAAILKPDADDDDSATRGAGRSAKRELGDV